MFLEKSALDQPRVIEYNVFVEEQSSLSVGWQARLLMLQLIFHTLADKMCVFNTFKLWQNL
jgi:hypothetical protein